MARNEWPRILARHGVRRSIILLILSIVGWPGLSLLLRSKRRFCWPIGNLELWPWRKSILLTHWRTLLLWILPGLVIILMGGRL